MISKRMHSVSLVFVMLLFFVYGMAIGKYNIFPYNVISSAKLRISRINSKKVTTQSYEATYIVKREFYHSFLHTGKIVMVGDSLTDNARWDDIFPNVSIVNRGIAGDTTQGIIDRLDDILSVKAEYGFIMVGTNDVGEKVSIDNIINNYNKIIDKFISQGTNITIQSTILAGKGQDDKNKIINLLNENLVKIAQSKKLQFIDLNKVLAPDGYLIGDYTYDGTHLNAHGYKMWQRVLQSNIDKISNKK